MRTNNGGCAFQTPPSPNPVTPPLSDTKIIFIKLIFLTHYLWYDDDGNTRYNDYCMYYYQTLLCNNKICGLNASRMPFFFSDTQRVNYYVENEIPDLYINIPLVTRFTTTPGV